GVTAESDLALRQRPFVMVEKPVIAELAEHALRRVWPPCVVVVVERHVAGHRVATCGRRPFGGTAPRWVATRRKLRQAACAQPTEQRDGSAPQEVPLD